MVLKDYVPKFGGTVIVATPTVPKHALPKHSSGVVKSGETTSPNDIEVDVGYVCMLSSGGRGDMKVVASKVVANYKQIRTRTSRQGEL